MVDDMENYSNMENWCVSGGPEATVSQSDQYVHSGKYSVRFRVKVDQNGGQAEHPSAWLFLKRLFIYPQDWSAYQSLEFYLYVPEKSPATVLKAAVICSTGEPAWNTINVKDLPFGQWNKIVIPFSGTTINGDLAKVAGIWFYVAESWYKDGDDLNFYLDDLALLSDKPEDLDGSQPVANDDPSGIVGSRPPALVSKPTVAAPLVDFEDLSGLTLRHSKGITASFCRSQEQPLDGKYVGKLEYKTAGASSWAEIVPPSPLTITEPFDSVECWIFRNTPEWLNVDQLRVNPPVPFVVVADGSGKQTEILLNNVSWSNWSIAHVKLPETIQPPAKLIKFGLKNLLPSADRPAIYYFDDLTFYKQHTDQIAVPASGKRPYPTTPDTILPSNETRDFTNNAGEQGGKYFLAYDGKDEKVRYEYAPKTGTLSDLKIYVGDQGPCEPFSGGGVTLDIAGKTFPPGDASVTAKMLSCSAEGNTVTAAWRLAARGVETDVTYRMEIKQKSLILGVSSPQTSVAELSLGKPTAPSGQVEGVYVPFLTYGGFIAKNPFSVYMADRKFFLSRLWDLYAMSASTLDEPDRVGYRLKTDGRRNALGERIFLTASSDFTEVLPNIPNPPSTAAAAMAPYVYGLDLCGFTTRQDQAISLKFAKALRRYGIVRFLNKMHVHTYASYLKWGWQPTMNADGVADNIEGGEVAFKEYLRQWQALGHKIALYTCYQLYDPLGKFWNEDYVTQDSTGNWNRWRNNWRHCYFLSPVMAPSVCRALSQSIEEKFHPDAVYDDCLTEVSGSRVADMDARKPGAGKLSTTFLASCEAPLIEKEIYHGAVYSEGDLQWHYAGIVDGNYAQSPHYTYKTPWLVDFDLLKIHPLETDIGMGYTLGGWGLPSEPWAHDVDIAAIIAHGHKGIIYGINSPTESQPLGPDKALLCKRYFLTQAIQSLYALAPVQKIEYFHDGRFLSVSDLLREKAIGENQIHTRYKNGLEVCVNGSLDKKSLWKVRIEGKDYALPSSGFVAFMPGKLLQFGAILEDHRADFVDGPDYIYADGRGIETDFGVIRTAGATIVRKVKPGEIEAIPVEEGAAIALRPDRLAWPGKNEFRVAALDFEGTEIWSKSLPLADGWLRLKGEGNIFSFRVTP